MLALLLGWVRGDLAGDRFYKSFIGLRLVAFQLSKYRMAVPLSPLSSESTEWLSHCRFSALKVPNGRSVVAFSTFKVPYFHLLSSFTFKTSLFSFIVQFQLQNFLILTYCPVSTFESSSSYGRKSILTSLLCIAKSFPAIASWEALWFRLIN